LLAFLGPFRLQRADSLSSHQTLTVFQRNYPHDVINYLCVLIFRERAKQTAECFRKLAPQALNRWAQWFEAQSKNDWRLLGEGFEFCHHAVEFVDERIRSRLAENIDQCAVVPERALLAASEAAENEIAFCAIVGEDFPGVGQFVGGGNEPDVFGRVRDLLDVGALSFTPFPFFTGDFVRIGAAIDDARDAFAEFFADFIEAREAALILDGIVQKGGDDFVFAAAVLNDDGRNTEQVTDIRLAFTLAALVQMQLSGVTKRLYKTVCEDRLFDDGLWASQLFRLSAAHLTEQAENFQIEPDERDHQAECAVPLHVLGHAIPHPGFNHVEIENQI
jgi:hypothetical protein